MNKTTIIGIVVGLMIGLIIGLMIVPNSHSTKGLSFGSTSCGSITCLSGGLRLVNDAGGDFESDVASVFGSTITGSGNLSITTTGTTTASFLSTSTTKGFCLAFNATSTNTLLNMTFAASSTAVSAKGVTPIITFGACN